MIFPEPCSSHSDMTITKKAFEFLLEIIRHEPESIKKYYESMLNSLKKKMITSEVVTEFIILAMPKGKDSF